jgi:hypothetical protein
MEQSAPGRRIGTFGLMGRHLCLVWALCCQAFSEQRSLFLAFFVGFFVRSGIPFLRPDPQYCKAGARRSCQGWPSHRPFQVLCPCQAHALTAPSTAAQSMSRDDDWRGAPLSVARINRATTLYAVGPGTRTMMHSCASAAKLRGGGPHSFPRHKAMTQAGTPPPRTVIGDPSQADGLGPKLSGCLQRPPFIALGAEPRHLAPRPRAPGATRRSEACAPRPRSWSCEYRGRSRYGFETTAPRHCLSGT